MLVLHAGDHPPTDQEGYLEFARSLPQKDIYEAIKQAEPIGPVFTYSRTENVRRHYEKVSLSEQTILALNSRSTCKRSGSFPYAQDLRPDINVAGMHRLTCQLGCASWGMPRLASTPYVSDLHPSAVRCSLDSLLVWLVECADAETSAA